MVASAEKPKGKAEAIIIELNTPGGLVDSMQQIVMKMMASEVPTVVYVAPSGARAASAGVFVTLAANIAYEMLSLVALRRAGEGARAASDRA